MVPCLKMMNRSPSPLLNCRELSLQAPLPTPSTDAATHSWWTQVDELTNIPQFRISSLERQVQTPVCLGFDMANEFIGHPHVFSAEHQDVVFSERPIYSDAILVQIHEFLCCIILLVFD